MHQIAIFIKSLPSAFKGLEIFKLQISKKRALAFCICITLLVMVLEIFYSMSANSLMLFSDGMHMLTHALSLGVTLIAILLSERSAKNTPSKPKTIELYAAIINGFGLALFTVYIIYESLERMHHLENLNIYDTLIIAIIGLMVNLLTAWILLQAGIEDLNTRSAYLHLLADTFSSVAIIAGCIIIYYTRWLIIDPLLSIVVAVVIGKWSYGLLKEAFQMIRNKEVNEG